MHATIGPHVSIPGGAEWVIILFIVLLFFGARKLPGLASSLGTSIREFRHAAKDGLEDEDEGVEAPADPDTER